MYIFAKVFGIEHLTYVAIFAFIAVAFILVNVFFVKSKKLRDIEMYVLAFLLLISLILNRIAISIYRETWTGLILDSYCGIASFVLPFCVFFYNKKNPLFQSIPLVSIIGGLVNIIYPSYLTQSESFFYFASITGLIHHCFGFLLSIYLYVFKYIDMDIKKWYIVPFTLSIMLFYSLLLVELDILPDSCNIVYPMLSNTILYGPFIALIAFALIAIITLVRYLILKKKSKSKNIN